MRKTIQEKIFDCLTVGPATLKEISDASGIRMGSVGVQILITRELGYVMEVGTQGKAKVWGVNPEAVLPGSRKPGRKKPVPVRESPRVVFSMPVDVIKSVPVVLGDEVFETQGRWIIPAYARVVDSGWQMLWRNERYVPASSTAVTL